MVKGLALHPVWAKVVCASRSSRSTIQLCCWHALLQRCATRRWLVAENPSYKKPNRGEPLPHVKKTRLCIRGALSLGHTHFIVVERRKKPGHPGALCRTTARSVSAQEVGGHGSAGLAHMLAACRCGASRICFIRAAYQCLSLSDSSWRLPQHGCRCCIRS